MSNNLYDQDYYLWIELEYSPSLKNYLNLNFETTYQKARKDASLETNLALLNTFPNQYPYTVEQVLDEDWLLE